MARFAHLARQAMGVWLQNHFESSCRRSLLARFLLHARLLSGFVARLGLRQQEEADAEQADGHSDARRRK